MVVRVVVNKFDMPAKHDMRRGSEWTASVGKPINPISADRDSGYRGRNGRTTKLPEVQLQVFQLIIKNSVTIVG